MFNGINYEDYILYVDDLSLEYTIGNKRVYALSHVTFGIRENESIGIVGGEWLWKVHTGNGNLAYSSPEHSGDLRQGILQGRGHCRF